MFFFLVVINVDDWLLYVSCSGHVLALIIFMKPITSTLKLYVKLSFETATGYIFWDFHGYNVSGESFQRYIPGVLVGSLLIITIKLCLSNTWTDFNKFKINPWCRVQHDSEESKSTVVFFISLFKVLWSFFDAWKRILMKISIT